MRWLTIQVQLLRRGGCYDGGALAGAWLTSQVRGWPLWDGRQAVGPPLAM